MGLRHIALGIGTAWAAVAVCAAAPAATNAPATLAQLTEQAAAYERSGQPRRAAETYERVVALDPGKETALAYTIAKLYADARDAPKALAWGRKVAPGHPDPQSYLAGLNARMGHYAEARRILNEELARTADPRRQVVLLWHLGEVCARQGDRDAAGEALREAVRVAEGRPEQASAERRLAEFLRAPTNRPAAAVTNRVGVGAPPQGKL